jgi:general secretion pathway protein L
MSIHSPMSTLILCLPLSPSVAAPEYDYVLTPDGQQLGAQGRAAAALLPAQGLRGAEVVAVVPARALSWHRLSLPERVLRSLLSGRSEPARARGVLAGVLEEQLLDEPERLHFAVFAAAAGDTDDAAQAWVAVCERGWLQSTLQALETAGRRVDRIVAECTPTPAGAPLALIGTDLEPAHMLLCTTQGVSLLPLLPSTLELARAHTDLQVFAEPAVMALAQSSFGNQVSLQTPAQRLLLAAQSPWNLAQLELSASPGGRLQRRLSAAWQQVAHAAPWRPVRWGLLALLLVQLGALNALAWHQRGVQDQQRAAIAGLLQQTFPEVRLVIDAPLQMQRAVDDLARARGAGADTDLGHIFSIIGPLLPAGVSVSAIDWSDKQLQLTTSGLDAASAPALTAGLQARGLRAQVLGGQLTITPKEPR